MNLFRLKKDDKKTEREKIDERREEVLAQGRKFKYPLQYTKYRIVVNTLLISFVIIAVSVVIGWVALYKIQMTDEILYRVTSILPVSVAKVDDEKVRFSDYLLLYRSSIFAVEHQSEVEVDDLKDQYKRAALTSAEEYTFANSLAKKINVAVTKQEINDEFERHRRIGSIERSEESFLKILKDNFNISKSEYERMLLLNLTKAKVSEAIDDNANAIAAQVEASLAVNNNNFADTAKQLGDKVIYEETGGLVDSKNVDGGRATEAMGLEIGAQSGKFVSINGDGYYFVKLVNKTASEVNFVSIFIPFNEFNKRFSELLNSDGTVDEYISLQ